MIRRILVPLDGSQLAESSLPHAVSIAKSFHAEILLFRVIETVSDGQPVDSVEWRLNQAEAAAYLESLAKRLEGVPVRTALAEGRAAEQIIRIAHEERIDLVVLTTHGLGGPSSFSMSGTAQKVVSGVGVSVLVVRPGEPPTDAFQPLRYRRVMSAVDCSARGDWALRLAARVAQAQQATLWMVHVVPVPEMARRAPCSPDEASLSQQVIASDRKVAEEHLRSAAARLSSPGIEVKTHVSLSPHVSETLEELVRREAIDLVVLCAHGLSGRTSQPYGGVASSILAACKAPVLVLQDLPRRVLVPPRASQVGGSVGQLTTRS